MRYRAWLVLGSLSLAVVVGGAFGRAEAEVSSTRVVGDSSTLTVDVVPLNAEVRLNGVPLGNAHDLIARSIPVVPGWHVVEVSAPGYVPSVVSVSATVDWSTRIWLQLVPDRSR